MKTESSGFQPSLRFKIHRWLEQTIMAAGGNIVSDGIGTNRAEFDVELDGFVYNISITPRPKQ